MEITEFKKRKREMEVAIIHAVSIAMEDFQNETGYCPKSIDVKLVDVSCIGDLKPTYLIADIVSEVDL